MKGLTFRKWAYAYMGIRIIDRSELPAGIVGKSPDIVIMDDLNHYARGYNKPTLQQEYMEYLCKAEDTKCSKLSTKTDACTTGRASIADYLHGSLKTKADLKSSAATKVLLTSSCMD